MINIKNLSFSYKKQRKLFDSLSMDLTPGSIAGLLGKNGAGKTTLLKMVSGILFPDSGELSVMGHQPAARKPSFLSDVFFVPEEFYLPSTSIRLYIKANSPFYPSFDSVLMTRLLNEFELEQENIIDQMSYGQKKKFLISFALATKCKLLILDEPTNGLDIPSKILFRKIMAGNLDDDQLVVISTHQVKDIETLIDTIIIVDNGSIILHKDIASITQQLHFTNSTVAEKEDILYSEAVPGGYRIITRQRNEESQIDIELLFNAVTKGKSLFNTSPTQAV
jgi:ABC-2 type transport system ATP-binding protein